MINQMKKYKDKILQILTLITENKKLPSLLLVCEITSHIMKNILNKIKLYIILKPNQAYLVMLITYFIMRASIAYCDILSDIAWWLGTGSSDSTGSDNSSDNSSESTSSGSDTELDDTIIPYLPQIIIDAAAWVGGIENLEDSTSSSDSSSDTSSDSADTDVVNTNTEVPNTNQINLDVSNINDVVTVFCDYLDYMADCKEENAISQCLEFMHSKFPHQLLAKNEFELQDTKSPINVFQDTLNAQMMSGQYEEPMMHMYISFRAGISSYNGGLLLNELDNPEIMEKIYINTIKVIYKAFEFLQDDV